MHIGNRCISADKARDMGNASSMLQKGFVFFPQQQFLKYEHWSAISKRVSLLRSGKACLPAEVQPLGAPKLRGAGAE